MGRKKKTAGPEGASAPIPSASVKIDPSIHSKLKIIAGVEGENISVIVNEMIRGPVEKRYRQALDKLNKAGEPTTPKRPRKVEGE